MLACTLPASADTSLEADFALFLSWFPGRYDNALQIHQQAAIEIPEDQKNYRRHSIFRRVELPAFGDVVFYAEQSRDGDLDNIYRLRIYALSLIPARNAFRLRVHIPKDTTPLKGAYKDPGLLSDLTPGTTIAWEGCDVFWTRIADRFEGSLGTGACQFFSPRFETEIVLEETLTLTNNALWFADRGLNLSGAYLFGMQGNVPAKALRARPSRYFENSRANEYDQSWLMFDQGGTYMLGDYKIELQRMGSSPTDILTMQIVDDESLWFSSGDGSEVAATLPDRELHCSSVPGHGYEDDQ